jgi:hypothetical protein
MIITFYLYWLAALPNTSFVNEDFLLWILKELLIGHQEVVFNIAEYADI